MAAAYKPYGMKSKHQSTKVKLDYRELSVGGGWGEDSETNVFGLLALGVYFSLF